MLKWTRVFLAVSFAALPALATRAHGGVPFGPYIFEYGWEEEPAVAGRANRINLTVSSSLPGGPPASLEGVTTEVHFEGEEIAITFTPAPTQLAGLFNAEFTPPGAGEYELHLSGQLDDQPLDVELHLDPVYSPTTAWLRETLGPNWPYWLGGVAVIVIAAAALLMRRRGRMRSE